MIIFTPIAVALVAAGSYALSRLRSSSSAGVRDAIQEELKNHPDLAAKAQTLLELGQDPDAMVAFAKELRKDGFVTTPTLLEKRAAELVDRMAHANGVVPSAPPAPPAPPVPPFTPPSPLTPPSAPPVKPPTQASGSLVAAAQKALNLLGYGPLVEDGISGPLTKAAVMKYQKDRGLTVDGIVGPQTGGALASDAAAKMNEPFGPPTPGQAPPSAGKPITVLILQKALNALGYGPLAEDGITGPKTKAAVMKFQKDHGLAADGIVGPQTEAALRATGV